MIIKGNNTYLTNNIVKQFVAAKAQLTYCLIYAAVVSPTWFL